MSERVAVIGSREYPRLKEAARRLVESQERREKENE